MSKDQEFIHLLARVGQQDRLSFEAVYRRSSPHLLAVLMRIVKSRAMAEDLLQEVYVKVWRNAASFDPAKSAPMTWLASVARNTAIDALRREHKEVISDNEFATGDDESSNMIEQQADPSPGPVELLLQSADQLAVRGCIETHLDATQRQAIALAFYQGLSHQEVAQTMGTPLGTVKSWIRRGLVALKQCFEDRAAKGKSHGL